MRLSTATFLIVILGLTSGCRLYGGHGSEGATFAQIQELLERSEARVARLEGDAQALAAASVDNVALAPFAFRTAGMQEVMNHALAFHRTTAAGVDAGSSYRDLSRALGAMILEQQIADDQYARLVSDMLSLPGSELMDESRYALVPAKLARLQGARDDVSIRDAVHGG